MPHMARSRRFAGVTIEVKEGELVALIGANGAGKTTTLATVVGVLTPTRGAITFRGEPIAGLPPEAIVRRGIAMVPEDREIFPALTVEQNLRLGAFVRRDREEYRRDLEAMSELFPILRERRDQSAGTLSGGEQQQLAIARALMSHPKLLMLDEPSLGLAPKLVGQVFELISRLHVERHDDPPGRAERQPDAPDRRSRLRDPHGPGRGRRHARGAAPTDRRRERLSRRRRAGADPGAA